MSALQGLPSILPHRRKARKAPAPEGGIEPGTLFLGGYTAADRGQGGAKSDSGEESPARTVISLG